jgi:general secretion pathway protein D
MAYQVIRRIVLKTTQRILTGWIAVAMSISAGFANASLPNGMVASMLGGAVVGQQGGSGSIFAGFGGRQTPPSDPFAARGATAAASADANGVTRLPPTGGPQPSVAPDRNAGAGIAAPQGMPAGGNQARSDALLRSARLALAVSDVQRASRLVAQARQEQVRYAPNEDSPERVEAAIARFTEVSRLDRSTEDGRKTYARMLMEQSEALLQWGELDQADKLAALAVEQRAAYSPFDAKPEDLLRRISALRQQNNPAGPRLIDSRNGGPNAAGPSLAGRQQAGELMRQIRAALAAKQITQAEFLCRQLDAMRIPESAFAPGEDSPGRVFQDVRQAMARNASGVVQAGGISEPNLGVQSAVYDPSRDPTRTMQIADQTETIPSPSNVPVTASAGGDAAKQSPGYTLFQQGETALKARDRDRALQLFQQASAYSNDLDPVTASRLQDHLSLLSVPRGAAPRTGPSTQPGTPADEAAAAQQALLRQVFADVNHREADAKKMLEKDPKMSLAMLQETRKKVESAGLEPGAREQLLRRLDRVIADTEHYIEQNHARIELDTTNNSVREGINREAAVKLQKQQKLAELVDQYNRLIEDQRFEEAEVIAKRAQELAPHEQVTQVMVSKIGILRKFDRERRIRDTKADNIADAFIDVDSASDPGKGEPYLFPDAKHWKEMTIKRTRKALELGRHHRSEKEIEIDKKLLTPVNYSCHNRPLSDVLNQLAKLVNVNIHIDDEGLREEGLSPDTPITLELASDIQLKSYLNLILEKHHLCYVIKNEVLNITSETKKGTHVYQTVYPVGDLVIPIPNFVASPRMGLAGALHDAMGNAVGTSNGFGATGTPMATVASREGRQTNATINPAVMANLAPRLPGGAGNQPVGFGPGGAGGGTSADFDTLIDLITQTVSPSTWDHNGGKGNIAASPTNLSLVVSQTQEVHEEIVDLLEQLRRMQDLQVTIEVRFITLSDQFFERIGVDFDFNIAKNIANPTAAGFSTNTQGFTQYTPNGKGVSVAGMAAGQQALNPAANAVQNAGLNSGIFSNDLGIPFTQDSFGVATPQFGGWAAGTGASMGFAILSDIEAYFFINAAQADKRSNVLQAPKVTLFNGQQAFISDTSQTPFVISVIPVVGDFAAAQQPVIVVLSEGTFLTVQAVVSNDRRFVRLTVVPFFSKIGNVQTFTFQGTDTTTTDTTRNGLVNQAQNLFNTNRDTQTSSHSGVTVQLPTFSFVTVTTTVSVPDGGTVLLGGIKRLSEGRQEDGVPILDKVPYLNRLFKNVGIGRDTSSLMMMVTPRIIIQEEEEDKMGINAGPP